MKRIPRSVKKQLRKKKAQIRQEIFGKEDQRKAIARLYDFLGKKEAEQKV
jgi:hypothetical protein